jgi:hypothetical protein
MKFALVSPPCNFDVDQRGEDMQMLQLIISDFYVIIIIGIQPLGRFWTETRAQSGDRCSSGMLHPRQVLTGRLPLLPPCFF